MNIQDVKVNKEEYKGRDMVDVLFEKQDELRLLYNVPICDLDVPSDQQQLRAMAWNVVEEMGEVIEVLETSDHRDHLIDESADMIAFYIELLLMSGLTRADVAMYKWEANRDLYLVDVNFTGFVSKLGIAINTLKNRYWRQSNVMTDSKLYKYRLLKTTDLLGRFLSSIGLSFDDVMDGYLKKYEVNKFRLRSNY